VCEIGLKHGRLCEQESQESDVPFSPNFGDVACAENRNKKHRRKMEDCSVVATVAGPVVGPIREGTTVPRSLVGSGGGVVGLFDGHAGRTAAEIAAREILLVLSTIIESDECTNNVQDGLDGVSLKVTPCPLVELGRAWMLGLQQQIEADETVPGHAGATAVLAAVSDRGRIVVANAGDARALAVHATAEGGADGASAVRLTYDHVASDEAEADRVRAAGGFVKDGRVNGQLAVTRCLGDALVKRYVVADPFVYVAQLTAGVTHLVFACDGVFDVFSDDEVASFVAKSLSEAAARSESVSYPAIAESLLALAIERGTTDNLSVLILPAQT